MDSKLLIRVAEKSCVVPIDVIFSLYSTSTYYVIPAEYESNQWVVVPPSSFPIASEYSDGLRLDISLVKVNLSNKRLKYLRIPACVLICMVGTFLYLRKFNFFLILLFSVIKKYNSFI